MGQVCIFKAFKYMYYHPMRVINYFCLSQSHLSTKIAASFFIFFRRPDFAAYISNYISWPVPRGPYTPKRAQPDGELEPIS
jgi:hypothetical protein